MQFPKGMDANEYALKVQPASKSLGIMLNRAAWLGKGERPTVAVIEPVKIDPVKIEPVKIEPPPPEPAPQVEAQTHQPTAEPPAAPIIEEKPEEKTEPAAKEENAIPLPASLPALPIIEEPEKVFPLAADPQTQRREESEPMATPPRERGAEWPVLDAPVEINGDEIVIHQGDRRYRVRGLGKNMSYELLRINLLVSGKNSRGESAFHVDTFDLYSARQRTVFLKQASEELGVKEDVIRRDLGHVLLQLEAMQDQQIKQTLEPKEKEIPIGEEERMAAMELLRDPRLLDRILADFERCGMVGEETNKLVSYLAVTSRLLDAPLAILVQASSAAGKVGLDGSRARTGARRTAGAVLGDDRAVALLHGRKRSETQGAGHRRRGRRAARRLRAETAAIGRRAHHRLNRKRRGPRDGSSRTSTASKAR